MPLAELWKIKDPNSWPLFELGAIDEAEFFRRFFLPATGQQLAPEASQQLKTAFFEAYEFVPAMETLLTELNCAGVRLWVHSNYSTWVEEVRHRLQLDRFFQGYSMSYDIKARKPQLEAYQRTLALIGTTASECLFIDDREENVQAATALGIKSWQFSDTPSLRAWLQTAGLLNSE
jgi:HAD superfamily hydrolase (TIGR01509 family)